MISDLYGTPPASTEENIRQATEEVEGRKHVKALDKAMEESDDPGILMSGLETVLEWIETPGNMLRTWASEALGLDVDPAHVEAGKVTAQEFIEGLSPEFKGFLKHEDLTAWDENKPFIENALNAFRAMGKNMITGAIKVGAPVVTDPLASLPTSIKVAHETAKTIGAIRAERAIQEKIKIIKDEALKAEKARDTVMKQYPPANAKERATLAGGTDTVSDTNATLKSIENDTIAQIKARELELQSGMGRTIELANQEAADQLVREGLGMSIDDARKLFPNRPVNDTQFAVWAKSNVVVIQSMLDVAAKLKHANTVGDVEGAKALRKKVQELYEAHRQLAMANESGLSAAGRVMRFSQEPTQVGSQLYKLDKIDDRIAKKALKADGDWDLFAEGLSAIEDPAKIMRVTERLNKPGMFERYRTLLINELLSGPATHILNLTTGVMSLTYAGLQKMSGALITNPLARNAEKADIRDATNYWVGALGAIPEALWAIAKMPFDKRQSLSKLMASSENKLHENRTLNFFGDPSESGPFVGFLKQAASSTVQAPVTALMMMDRGLRHVMANAELRFLVSQHADEVVASRKGLSWSEKNKLRRDTIQEAYANPDKYGLLYKQALDHADDGIFTSRLKGTQAKFEETRTSSRVIQTLIPFYKAIMNIGNYEVRRLPIIQFMSKDFRSQLTSTDPLVRQMAHGNLAMGTSVALLGTEMAMNGQIIGRAPVDPKQADMMRKLGIEPYSLVFDTDGDGQPDEYVSYKNWGVFGTILGSMANIQQGRAFWSDEEYEKAVMGVIAGVGELLLDKTIAESLHEMGTNMTRFIDNPGELTNAMNRTAATYSLLNPKIAEFARRIDDGVIRDPEGFIEIIMSKTPMLSDKIPAQRDLTGEEVYYGFHDPNAGLLERTLIHMTASTAGGKQLDARQKQVLKVVQPLLDEGISVSQPERQIGNVLLDKAQMDRYSEVFYKGTGKLDTTLLEDLSREYADWVDFTKQLDQGFLQQYLLQGGLDPALLTNLSPNKVLQAKVNSVTDKRKQAAVEVLIKEFGNEVGDKLIADQKLRSLVKKERPNPVAVSPGGRAVSDVIRQYQGDTNGSAVQDIMEFPAQVQREIEFSLGGQ